MFVELIAVWKTVRMEVGEANSLRVVRAGNAGGVRPERWKRVRVAIGSAITATSPAMSWMPRLALPRN